MTEPLRILSLGAGVQSTAVLQLALTGEIQIDAAIFSDTGWEPRAVYEHLEDLEQRAQAAGIPLFRVSNGNIRDTGLEDKSFFDAPFYLLNQDGSHGMARRQCTHQLKIRPIRVKVRELMEDAGLTIKDRPAVIQYLGISWDEIQRMKPSDVKFVEHQWPLIDRRWTRHDCLQYLRERGIDAPRSACIGCPYHSNKEWRNLKLNAPEEFADAVKFELEVQRAGGGLLGKPFLHAARVPLSEIDFANAEDRGQLTFDDECEGMCGM